MMYGSYILTSAEGSGSAALWITQQANLTQELVVLVVLIAIALALILVCGLLGSREKKKAKESAEGQPPAFETEQPTFRAERAAEPAAAPEEIVAPSASEAEWGVKLPAAIVGDVTAPSPTQVEVEPEPSAPVSHEVASPATFLEAEPAPTIEAETEATLVSSQADFPIDASDELERIIEDEETEGMASTLPETPSAPEAEWKGRPPAARAEEAPAGAQLDASDLTEEVIEVKEAEKSRPVPDNLKIIEGIGPKVSSLLNEAGIFTFAQLAETDISALREIVDAAGLRMMDPSTWPLQAKLVAAGDQDGLEKLQNQLKGGRLL